MTTTRSIAVLLLLTLAPWVQAQEPPKGPLKSAMAAFLITLDKEGNEVSSPTEEAEPGQVIEYRMAHTNIGKGPLRDLVIVGPVPSNTTYLAGTNKTKVAHEFTVSIDGGATWDKEPVKRMRRNEKGEEVEVIIPPSEYTHARWVVKSALAKGKQFEFSYRVQVD